MEYFKLNVNGLKSVDLAAPTALYLCREAGVQTRRRRGRSRQTAISEAIYGTPPVGPPSIRALVPTVY